MGILGLMWSFGRKNERFKITETNTIFVQKQRKIGRKVLRNNKFNEILSPKFFVPLNNFCTQNKGLYVGMEERRIHSFVRCGKNKQHFSFTLIVAMLLSRKSKRSSLPVLIRESISFLEQTRFDSSKMSKTAKSSCFNCNRWHRK